MCVEEIRYKLDVHTKMTSVLETAMPRLKKQRTPKMDQKLYLGMHFDSDRHVHVSSSLKTLVDSLNVGRRGPSRLAVSHAWDCVTYKARHHKAWIFRVVARDTFETMAAERGWVLIKH